MGDVAIESGQLRIGSKWYALANLSSVEAGYTKRRPGAPVAGILVLLLGLALIVAYFALLPGLDAEVRRWSGNTAGQRYQDALAHRATVRAIPVVGLMLSAAGAGLFSFSAKRLAARYQVLIRGVSGEYHTVIFPDERACLAFCETLNAAIAIAGHPLKVDARSLHVHPPSTPHLR